MARITQYTQENTPQAVNQAQASAASFGGNQAGLMAQADALQQSAQAAADTGERIAQIETKRRNRVDTINVARMADSFYNDAFAEYNRALAEDDIIDPSTTDKFNARIREKSAEILSKFEGSEEARAKLELEIMNQASAFTRQMTTTGIAAQRDFITKKASDKIATLSAQVRENPAKFNEIMMAADGVVKELSPALYAEDEAAMTAAAREQITLTALNTYIDRGMYDDANAFIDANPAILASLQPEMQRRVLGEINAGIADRDKVINEAKKKRDLLEWGEGVTGQKVDNMSALNFILGTNVKKTDEQVISDIANIYNMRPEEVPPEVIMKVKYPDIKLFDAESDPNKDFSADGKISVSGVQKAIKPIVLTAEEIRRQRTMLNIAIEQAKAGNKAAGQAAVTAFKKMLDPTSAVMEGEITMLAEAEGLSGRIDKMFDPGKPVSNEQLEELKSFGEKFTDDLLKSKKSKLDGYLKDSDSRGFRRIDIGLPKEVYADIFGTETLEGNNVPAPTGLDKLSDDELRRMLEEMDQ